MRPLLTFGVLFVIACGGQDAPGTPEVGVSMMVDGERKTPAVAVHFADQTSFTLHANMSVRTMTGNFAISALMPALGVPMNCRKDATSTASVIFSVPAAPRYLHYVASDEACKVTFSMVGRRHGEVNAGTFSATLSPEVGTEGPALVITDGTFRVMVP